MNEKLYQDIKESFALAMSYYLTGEQIQEILDTVDDAVFNNIADEFEDE